MDQRGVNVAAGDTKGIEVFGNLQGHLRTIYGCKAFFITCVNDVGCLFTNTEN